MDLLEEYRRAELFFDAGDPAEAARLLEPIVAAEPANAAVRQLLARAYFHSAQLGRAEQHLRELVTREPTDHYAQHVLGRTLERLGRPGEALGHLRIAAAMRADEEYDAAARRVAGTVRRSRPPGRGAG
ncbi:MAG TPA: tetratricopeptide repeat protein [Pilimelia sp.]|nr:tetratricopeptide repeat protein [Pilimelia sp.]